MKDLHFDKLADRSSGLDTSRRFALNRGLAGVAGVAMLCLTHHAARAADGKLSKVAVQYVDHGNVAGKDCDDCIHYLPPPTADGPATCKIVEGSISPHGHCIAFSLKR